MILDTPSEEALDRLTRFAARLTRAPVSLISLVDDHRQFFKSIVGLSEPWASMRETPLSNSFCQHVVTSAQPLVIEDARVHQLVCDNDAICDLKVVAYLGVPLLIGNGHVLGSLCVIDSVPRRWTDDDVETVRELAGSVMTEIELRSSIRDAQAERELRKSVMERVSDAFYALDRDWLFIYLNPRCDSLLQRPGQGLVGRNI